MKKGKLGVSVIAVSLFGALLLVSCKKEKGNIAVTTEIISNKTEVECSNIQTKKELEIGEGMYSFEMQDISTIGGTLNIQIEDAAGTSVIEANDNVLDDFSLEVNENSKTIVLKADSKKAYKNLNCTVSVYASVNSVSISKTANITYSAPKTETISITTKQAAIVKVFGTCVQMDCIVGDAAQVDASALKAKRVKVNASGSAQAAVFADNAIEIDASGASVVTYEGNPETVEKQTAGAASIEIK